MESGSGGSYGRPRPGDIDLESADLEAKDMGSYFNYIGVW